MTPSDALQGLYPFLHGDKRSAEQMDLALLESVRQKADDSIATKQAFFTANGPALVAAARAVATVYRNNGRLFTMGNGGSSCDAQHVAVEFQHPVTAGRPALTAVNLGADTAMLTAVGNDVGFSHVFVRQLIALARPGDGLIGFSTSGNSENLLAAFAKAKALGVTTLGFCGGDGGRMASTGDVEHCLVVPSASIHRVQEAHVAAYHILWDLVHTLLADDRGHVRSNAT